MMVCHISFDESYGIGTDCLVTVEISVVDNLYPMRCLPIGRVRFRGR